MAKTLGLTGRQWLLFLHYIMLAGALVGYYSYVHPPTAATNIAYMFVELVALLTISDQIIHKIVGVD